MSHLLFYGYKYTVVFWWKIRAPHSDISFYGIPGHCVGPPGYIATSAIEYFTAAYKVRANDQSQTVKNAAMLGKFLTVRSLCALCQANTYRNIPHSLFSNNCLMSSMPPCISSFITLSTGLSCYQDTYGLRYYAKAQNLARLGAAQYDAKLEEYSVLIMPTIKFRPPKLLPPELKEDGKCYKFEPYTPDCDTRS